MMHRLLMSNSNISLDSLEIESNKKYILNMNEDKRSDENVDTILVPFYENDILMKVPKGSKQQRQLRSKCIKKDNFKGETEQYRSYLVNKNIQKGKKTSYLEMFRKQFSCNYNEIQNKDVNEIRSLSPAFGDTERESIGDDCNNNIANEFFNTESYNEIYYEKLMNQELEQYLDKSFEETLRLNENYGGKTSEDIDDNNLRSISEVSQRRRHVRRTTVPLNHNIHLGGLGPDMENIRPRLERAKSLQRYSEKVRMENRLKIYKQSIEAEKEKKAERTPSAQRHSSSIMKCKIQNGNKKTSYLVNKVQEKSSVMKKNCPSKSKSAEVQKQKERNTQEIINIGNQKCKEKDLKTSRIIERKLLSAKDGLQKYIKTNCETIRVKSSTKKPEINTAEKQDNNVSPIQISFLVNVGGIRPSSALKSLEEQHRIYQEKVKEFNTDQNNVLT